MVTDELNAKFHNCKLVIRWRGMVSECEWDCIGIDIIIMWYVGFIGFTPCEVERTSITGSIRAFIRDEA
jgi:hypothetical protein